jgi:hypothetical protein
MIDMNLAARDETRLEHLVVKEPYGTPMYDKWQPQQLSPVAQKVLDDVCPNEIRGRGSAMRPEVTALRILDFLSSRQGYIRRKGLSFRTEVFYRSALPKLFKQIEHGLPIELNSLCLCTTLANIRYAGESPYPHMGAFIAFENLHKIIQGVRAIYKPGIKMTLGYEGTLFEPLYFQSKSIVKQSLIILQQLNELAARNIWGSEDNPIKVVDALWMIERSFDSVEGFMKRVETLAPTLPEDPSSAAWQQWYDETVSDYYFPSRKERANFISEQARWRQAVLYLKYHEGIRGHGFMEYSDNITTFTPSGRRQNMLALQLIPENSHLPHQRVITYDAANNKWRTMAFKTVSESNDAYAPRYVAQYSYPFYFEKVTRSHLQPQLINTIQEPLTHHLQYSTLY